MIMKKDTEVITITIVLMFKHEPFFFGGGRGLFAILYSVSLVGDV